MTKRPLDEQLKAARERHRAGDYAGALAGYRKILGRQPRVPEILVLAATAALDLGRHEEAERLARRAVHVRADGPGQLTLGRVLLERGDLAAARQTLKAAAGDPRVAADAHYLLGEARLDAGETESARAAFELAVEDRPGHGRAWLALGRLHGRAGRQAEALSALERAARLRPRDAECQLALGRAALTAGRYRLAERALAAATAADPDAPRVLALLGRLRKAQGRLNEALAAWERLTRSRPDDPDAWAGLAATRQAAGALASAGEAYERGLALAPDDPDLRAGRAEWLEWQGRYEEGLAVLEAPGGDAPPAPAAGASPGLALVRARLLRRLGRSEEALATLQTVDAAGLDATLRRQLAFSLGDAADALGRFDEAFDHYAEGNRLAPLSWNGRAERDWQARLDALAADPGEGDAGQRIVFVLGLPRSGTTLVEQILAAHPQVCPGGESPTLGLLAHEAAALERPPAARELADLGQRYLAALPAASRGAVRVTDKMPLNFRYLGLLQAALPGARIVHCRRDVRDVAVSCFATDFIDPALGFATRMDWIADYVRFYEDIMARWLPRLELPVLELPYEALVRSPERWIRRLIEFAGLPWDDACLTFHRQQRVALTASHAQVREPVYTRSVGRWRHYRARLAELGDLLERPGPEPA